MSGLDKRRILQGSASNLTRVFLGMLISLVLPHFLVHHMGTVEYSAWVLILQLSAYVNFLDLGLQTAIGKFVAEYHAAGNNGAARKTISTAFTVMVGAAIIGAIAIVGMVWQVPHLFAQMPAAVVGDMRCGLLAVGISVALSLPFGVFLATFTGLQEYGFPTALIATSRVVSTIGLIVLLLMHGTLVEMALLMAACNICTALLQFVGWKRYASNRIGFNLFGFDRSTSTPPAGVLRHSHHLDHRQSLDQWTRHHHCGSLRLQEHRLLCSCCQRDEFFAAAGQQSAGPAAAGDFVAAGAAQRGREFGDLLVRATRLSTALLCMLGIPLLFLGFPLLRIWVGGHYASHALVYLEALVVANVVRQFAYPYALMVVGLGQQRFATVSPVLEAIINLTCSILLARRYGAIGVAAGTLIGAFTGVTAHLLISMPRTRAAVSVARCALIREGVAASLAQLSATVVVPALLAAVLLFSASRAGLALWAIATASILWWVGLAANDRSR